MPSKSAIIAFHYHVLSGLQPLVQVVESQISEAYLSGFSVIEITRVSGSKKADYTHAVLVKRGLIIPAKRGRPQKGSVPQVIERYLKTRALSFAKWCTGWGFNLSEAADGINSNLQRCDEIEDAVRRDFPGLYAKIKGLKKYAEFFRPPTCISDKLEAVIVWDSQENCYQASKMGDGAISGYGISMEAAIRNLKIYYNYKMIQNRLTIGCGVSAQ